MWTVHEEPANGPAAMALLREYFTELTERYWHRSASAQEIDDTLAEFAHFLVLRADGEPAGCLGLHATGELTRVYVSPQFGRGGGARALLAAAETTARADGLTRLFLDTRTDLIEARAFYAGAGFTEIPPSTTAPGPFQDHWFEKVLADRPEKRNA